MGARRPRGQVLALILCALSWGVAAAQDTEIQEGDRVPTDVRLIYDHGLSFLAGSQKPDGSWGSRNNQPAVTGLALMAFLASGEDPNYGAYSVQVRKAVVSLINSQDTSSGYFGPSMYNHGFAMLGLAEAYGAVDEELLWDDASGGGRSIAEALELAVACAVTAQTKSQPGAWRYMPTSADADTSVSGAVLMGVLAARNAGIAVPESCIEKALQFYKKSTSGDGAVGYAGAGRGGGSRSMNRSAIATTVFAVANKTDWAEYSAALGYLTSRLEEQNTGHPYYFRYYMSQALFQGDVEAWARWNREVVRILRDQQRPDGSFLATHGTDYGTAMSLLALALNFKMLPIYER